MTATPPDLTPFDENQRSVRRLKATRVRLIISIPTLLLLLTLGTGLFSYQYLLGRADRQKLLAAAAPTHTQATKHLEMEGILEEAAIRVLPPKLAKGALGEHYRLGWEEQKKAGSSLIDESRMVDLPDRLPEGAVLPGHYDPASGQTEALRGMPGSEAGAIPSLPPGLGGKP